MSETQKDKRVTVSVRLGRYLYDHLVAVAEREHRTIGAQALDYIADGLALDDKPPSAAVAKDQVINDLVRQMETQVTELKAVAAQLADRNQS
jgi:hypothetical protein